jgi:hypothetical protein
MDPTELAAYVGPSALAYKVLGPSADLLGDELKAWTERRLNNLRRIFATLGHKYDESELDDLGPGSVPPRVLHGILTEGSYAEDDVEREYYAGILASARSEVGQDDAAAALLAVLHSMSALQLRTHFVIYRTAQEGFAEAIADQAEAGSKREDAIWESKWQREWLASVAIPHSEFSEAVHGPAMESWELTLSAVSALGRLDLLRPATNESTGLADGSRFVEMYNPRKEITTWPGPCYRFYLTAFGLELYCAAHGFHRPYFDFKRPIEDFHSRFAVDIPLCEPITDGEPTERSRRRAAEEPRQQG